MKEIINIIEQTMNNNQRAVTSNNQNKSLDQQFQLTLLAIATILLCLMEWIY